MEASEILSAFVDGEPVDPGGLAAALGQPGARETLIEFVRLRAALDDGERPSDALVRRMRTRLGRPARRRAQVLLRVAAALAIVALAVVGAFDLVRGLRPGRPSDEPPVATRVIRFEPGVDWKPIDKPSQGR